MFVLEGVFEVPELALLGDDVNHLVVCRCHYLRAVGDGPDAACDAPHGDEVLVRVVCAVVVPHLTRRSGMLHDEANYGAGACWRDWGMLERKLVSSDLVKFSQEFPWRFRRGVGRVNLWSQSEGATSTQ